MHPGAPSRPSFRAAGRGELRTGVRGWSARGGGAVVYDRPRLGDRRLRVEPQRVVEAVHYVAVGAERESAVVAELAGDIDHGAPLVEQQGRERVPEIIRPAVVQARRLDCPLDCPPAPRLVRREGARRPSRRTRTRSARAGAAAHPSGVLGSPQDTCGSQRAVRRHRRRRHPVAWSSLRHPRHRSHARP